MVKRLLVKLKLKFCFNQFAEFFKLVGMQLAVRFKSIKLAKPKLV